MDHVVLEENSSVNIHGSHQIRDWTEYFTSLSCQIFFQRKKILPDIKLLPFMIKSKEKVEWNWTLPASLILNFQLGKSKQYICLFFFSQSNSLTDHCGLLSFQIPLITQNFSSDIITVLTFSVCLRRWRRRILLFWLSLFKQQRGAFGVNKMVNETRFLGKEIPKKISSVSKWLIQGANF